MRSHIMTSRGDESSKALKLPKIRASNKKKKTIDAQIDKVISNIKKERSELRVVDDFKDQLEDIDEDKLVVE